MTDDADPITLTVEIDASGHETVAELVGTNLQQALTAQGMGLVNAIWDNRDQIAVEPDDIETPQVPDQPGGDGYCMDFQV